MAGWLAGTDNIFQRASYQASSTYGIGGNGETHQYVAETDAAWADAATQATARPSASSTRRTRLHPMHPGMPRRQRPAYARTSPAGTGSAAGTRRNIFLHRTCLPTRHPACPDLCPNGLNWRYIINKANQINGYGDIDMATAAEIWGYNYNKSALGGNMYNAINYELPGRISDVKKAVTALQATVAAQKRQIDKLTTALGSNPEDIADRTAKPSATKSTNSSSP